MEKAQLNVRLSKDVVKQIRLNAVMSDKSIEDYMEDFLRRNLGIRDAQKPKK
jgi:predicted HicB family RNase H-like nuclease